MLSEKIKENTKINHQSLEKKLVARMRSIQNETDYAKFLGIFYSYFGGLELTINRHLDLSHLPDYGRRRKTSTLEDDLNMLGLQLPTLASESALPEIENHYQALGALYVIEGSTLGGEFIGKILRRQMNLTGSFGMSFFDGYGDQTASMWQVFQEFLDQPVYLQKHEMITQSANQTFIGFERWFNNLNDATY